MAGGGYDIGISGSSSSSASNALNSAFEVSGGGSNKTSVYVIAGVIVAILAGLIFLFTRKR